MAVYHRIRVFVSLYSILLELCEKLLKGRERGDEEHAWPYTHCDSRQEKIVALKSTNNGLCPEVKEWTAKAELYRTKAIAGILKGKE